MDYNNSCDSSDNSSPTPPLSYLVKYSWIHHIRSFLSKISALKKCFKCLKSAKIQDLKYIILIVVIMAIVIPPYLPPSRITTRLICCHVCEFSHVYVFRCVRSAPYKTLQTWLQFVLMWSFCWCTSFLLMCVIFREIICKQTRKGLLSPPYVQMTTFHHLNYFNLIRK